MNWLFFQRRKPTPGTRGHHVMVDLETLNTVPGGIILSIGAVYFDRQGLGEEFYSVINCQSCYDAGLTHSVDTVEWWQKQSEEARRVLTQAAQADAPSLSHVLRTFNRFLGRQTSVRVWGNGADFDNALLAAAYAAARVPPGWAPYNGRCYRTLKNLVPGPKLQRVGTYHNALDDAKSQAFHAIEIFRQHPHLELS